MLFRTIYISNPAILRLKDKQMKIRTTANDFDLGSVPVEDIGIVMLDHNQITITHALLQALIENNVIVITCDKNHMPLGMMISNRGHSEYAEHVRTQLEVTEALKKQLWLQIIRAKLTNQRALLELYALPSDMMKGYIACLKPGDDTNMEGVAAGYYWRQLFSSTFRRGRTEDLPNALLNYGYAILRAIIARSLSASGLLLCIGLFHHNKYDPYCLADDLMEPFRPFIDRLCLEWLADHPDDTELTKEARVHLMQCATMDVAIADRTSPLLVAARDAASSLYACYTGKKRKLLLPSFVST